MHYLLMYIKNSSNLLLHFPLKYLENVNPCHISAHSVDQLIFFNSRSHKFTIKYCITMNYPYFINIKIGIN